MSSLSQEIPAHFITQEEVNSKLQCTICLEDFHFKELVRKLICQHIYHGPCIVPWLQQHNTCPTCRMILGEEIHHSDDEGSVIDIEFEESALSSSDSNSGHQEDIGDWIIFSSQIEENDQSFSEENTVDRESLSDYDSNSNEGGYSNEDHFSDEINDEENSSLDVLNYSDNDEENQSDDVRLFSEDSPSRESVSFPFTEEDTDERQSLEEDLSDRGINFDTDDHSSHCTYIDSDDERYSDGDGNSDGINIIDLVESSGDEEEMQQNNESHDDQDNFEGENTIDVVTCSDTNERSSCSSEDDYYNRVLFVDLEKFSEPHERKQNTFTKDRDTIRESFVHCLALQDTVEENCLEERQHADESVSDRNIFVNLETHGDREEHSNVSPNHYMHIKKEKAERKNLINALDNISVACSSGDKMLQKQLFTNVLEGCSNGTTHSYNKSLNIEEPCRSEGQSSAKMHLYAENPNTTGCSAEMKYYYEKQESSEDDCSDKESVIVFKSCLRDKQSSCLAPGTVDCAKGLSNSSCQHLCEKLPSSSNKILHFGNHFEKESISDLENVTSLEKHSVKEDHTGYDVLSNSNLDIHEEAHSDRDSFVDVENDIDEESVAVLQTLSDEESGIDVEVLSNGENFIDVDNYSEDLARETHDSKSHNNTFEKEPTAWENDSEYYSTKPVNSILKGLSDSERLKSVLNSENCSTYFQHNEKRSSGEEEYIRPFVRANLLMGERSLSKESLFSVEEQRDEELSSKEASSILDEEIYSDLSAQTSEEGLSWDENHSQNDNNVREVNWRKVDHVKAGMCFTGMQSYVDANFRTKSEGDSSSSEQNVCSKQKQCNKILLDIPLKNFSEGRHCVLDNIHLKEESSEEANNYVEDFITVDQETNYSSQSENFYRNNSSNKTFCEETISNQGKSINVIANYDEPLHNNTEKSDLWKISNKNYFKSICDRKHNRKKTVPLLRASLLVKSMFPKVTTPSGKLVLSGKTGLMKKKIMLKNPLVKTLMNASAIMRKSAQVNKTFWLPKTSVLRNIHQRKNANEMYNSYFSKKASLLSKTALLRKAPLVKDGTATPRDAALMQKENVKWKVDVMGKFHFVLKANMIDKSLLVRKNILSKKAILWRRGVLKAFFPIMKASFTNKNLFSKSIMSANVTHLKNDVKIWRTTLIRKPNLSRKVTMTSIVHVMSKLTLMKKSTNEKSPLRRFPIAAKDLTLIKIAMLRVAALIRKTYLKKTVISIREARLKRKSLLVNKHHIKKRRISELNNSISDKIYDKKSCSIKNASQ